MKSIYVIFVCLVALALSGVLQAQAIPTATRSPVEIGVAGSIGSSDYGPDYIKGFTIFGGMNFSRRLGVEAEFHDTSLSTPTMPGNRPFSSAPDTPLRLRTERTSMLKFSAALADLLTSLHCTSATPIPMQSAQSARASSFASRPTSECAPSTSNTRRGPAFLPVV
jgi:hypothetical protein